MNLLIRVLCVFAFAQVVFGCDSAEIQIDQSPLPSGGMSATNVNAASVIGHDFGILAPQQMAEQPYRITNRSNDTVSITGVEYQCGCTIAAFSAKTMPPHGHIDAKVQFRAGVDMGDFVKQVKVKLDGKTPFVILKVVASVRKALHVTPAELVVSGSRDSGPLIRDFVVSKYTADPWRQLRVACSHPWFTAISTESDVPLSSATSNISLCQQWCLSVRIDPENKSLNEGLNHGRISIAGPESTEIDIPIQFSLKPRYVIIPDQLVFYAYGKGPSTPSKKRIVLTAPTTAELQNRSKLNLKLRPESSDLTLTSSHTETAANVWIIEIGYSDSASRPRGVKRYQLDIVWEGDEKPCTTVPIKVVGEN